MTSRRGFLTTSGRAASAAWLARLSPAALTALQACAADSRRAGAAFTTFSPREGADFDAQPTMTIQALAFRAADRITALARAGSV